jgi:hypothetical protein
LAVQLVPQSVASQPAVLAVRLLVALSAQLVARSLVLLQHHRAMAARAVRLTCAMTASAKLFARHAEQLPESNKIKAVLRSRLFHDLKSCLDQ